MAGIADKVLRKAKIAFKSNVKKNENPIKWGIIGTGYMSETLGAAIDGNTDGVVAAVASRTLAKAKSFAGKHGNCKAYGSYKEIAIDNALDVIYIATPAKQHHEHIKLCLMAGKNVLCEKPITLNNAELVELQAIAAEKKCFLMEGMWMKCLPTYQKALAWIDAGRIGTVELIKVDFYKRKEIEPYSTIVNRDMGGGVIRDYGVYAVAFPTDFMDKDIKVTGNHRDSFYGIDSDWAIHMSDGKIQAFVSISSDFSGTSKAAVMGTNGTIEWNAPFNRTNVITLYDVSGKQVDQYKASYDYEGFEYEVNEVQQCIRNHQAESKKVSLAASAKVLNMIDELMK